MTIGKQNRKWPLETCRTLNCTRAVRSRFGFLRSVCFSWSGVAHGRSLPRLELTYHCRTKVDSYRGNPRMEQKSECRGPSDVRSKRSSMNVPGKSGKVLSRVSKTPKRCPVGNELKEHIWKEHDSFCANAGNGPRIDGKWREECSDLPLDPLDTHLRDHSGNHHHHRSAEHVL